MIDLKKLKLRGTGISVLYVEDDPKLLNNGSILFRKLFRDVYAAQDGEAGLELFKKYNPDILITDINMPKMNGLELSKEVKKISPQTKIIIISAHDEKEILKHYINLKIFRFIKKPINVSELLNTLSLAIKEIKDEQNKQIFSTQQNKLLDNQSVMVLMLNEDTPIMANKVFLDFFNVNTIEEFNDKCSDFGSLFLKHEGFLYNDSNISWKEKIYSSEQNIFNVEMKDKDENINHFLLKYKTIPDDDTHVIISLDNITQLNLMHLYSKEVDTKKEAERGYMINLLTVLKENTAKLQMHNYYKGLSITNHGIIVDIDEARIVLKTNQMQLKAIQNEKRVVIVSETLPHSIICENIAKIEFTNQMAEFKSFYFIETSPITRKNVRVRPDDNYSVTLSVNDHNYGGDISIKDISVDAVKLKLDALPAGIHKEESEIYIEIILNYDTEPVAIGSKGRYLREDEYDDSYSIVFMMDFGFEQKSALIKYIAKRQMALIREFKGL